MGRPAGITNTWRDHFSANAGDLIQIHRAFCGPKIAQRIMLESFNRRRGDGKIDECTVCAVLNELNIHIDDDGNCTIEGR